MNWYNDNEPFAAQWLRNLIAAGHIGAGTVDERSIHDVRTEDLAGFTRCHFFAGIAGFELALNLAGWTDRPVWTGSCPCQPFSAAGKRKGGDDDRNLWPVWFELIRVCRPPTIFGEQVEAAIGLGWLDRVFDDLEAEGYQTWACVLPACSVGAPHIRSRLFWVANSSRRGFGAHGGASGDAGHADERDEDGGMGNPPRYEQRRNPLSRAHREGIASRGSGGNVILGNTISERLARRQSEPGSDGGELQTPERAGNFWSDYSIVWCRDPKGGPDIPRRCPKPSFLGMVDGISIFLARGGSLDVSEVLFFMRQGSCGNDGLEAAAFLFASVFWQMETVNSEVSQHWQEACSGAFRREGMLEVWEHAKTSAASQGFQSTKQRFGKRRNSLRELPQEYSRLGWKLEYWSWADEYLRCLWQYLLCQGSSETGKDLFSIMPERMGSPLCNEKVQGRVGMLRATGNSIVPEVAAEFVKAFIELKIGTGNQ